MPRQRPLNPVGLTALITGASGGIGMEMARRHARLGGVPVLVARSGDKLQRLADELLTAHGIDAPVIKADLAKPDAAEQLWKAVQSRSLTVDILINNAGFGGSGRVWERDADDERDMMRLNVETLAMLTRYALPGMVSRGRGSVLNVGSSAGFVPGPRMATYYATKAFVLSYTEALSVELEGTGVFASVLAPGPVKTGFQARADMSAREFEARAMAADDVAEIGYTGMLRGETVIVPGSDVKAALGVAGLLPRGLKRRIMGRVNERMTRTR